MNKRVMMNNLIPGFLVVAAVAAVAFALIHETRAASTNSGGATVGSVAAVEFAFRPDLRRLADESTNIIKGTVVEHTPSTMDYGLRALVPVIITKVRVDEELKGRTGQEYISVGQKDSADDPAVPLGSSAVFFLAKIDHERTDLDYPYDYHTTVGPQGKFLINQGRISPMAPAHAPTTERYRSKQVGEFVLEVGMVLRQEEP